MILWEKTWSSDKTNHKWSSLIKLGWAEASRTLVLYLDLATKVRQKENIYNTTIDAKLKKVIILFIIFQE